MDLNDLSYAVIGAAIKVHKKLGPGLLESVYEACLAYELEKLGLKVDRQVPVPIIYEEIKLDCGYRMDLLVNDELIIELKTVDELTPVHEAQTLTYLKVAGKKLALLINFNVLVLKDGIRRFIN